MSTSCTSSHEDPVPINIEGQNLHLIKKTTELSAEWVVQLSGRQFIDLDWRVNVIVVGVRHLFGLISVVKLMILVAKEVEMFNFFVVSVRLYFNRKRWNIIFVVLVYGLHGGA